MKYKLFFLFLTSFFISSLYEGIAQGCSPIVLIFEHNSDNLYVKGESSGFFYFNQNIKFYSSTLNEQVNYSPNNKIKNDTLRILPEGHNLSLTYQYKFSNAHYLLKSGDTAIFKFDAIYNMPVCKLHTRQVADAEMNFLYLFRKNFGYKSPIDVDFLSLASPIKNTTRVQRAKRIAALSEDYLKRERRYLDSLYLIGGISREGYAHLSEQIRWESFGLKVAPLLTSSRLLQPFSDEAKCDSLLCIGSYRQFLENYCLANKGFVSVSNGSIFNYPAAFDSVLAASSYSEKNREYLLNWLLSSIQRELSNDTYSSYLNKFKVAVKDTAMLRRVNDQSLLITAAVDVEKTGLMLASIDGKQKTFDQLMAGLKGKVVYVDFWASWCAPCRASMPESNKLRAELGKENVAFVYISLDNKLDSWKSASLDEGLSKYHSSFVAVAPQKTRFLLDLKVVSIPRYLLFSKEGKLVHANAPGPEGEAIRKELDKLLKE